MIITPSVFITTSFDTAFKFMKADSYKQFYSRLSQDERESTILVAPSKDHGLLEFTYTAEKEDLNITLKFAETSDQFEAFIDSINGSHSYAQNLISKGIQNLKAEDINELYDIQGSSDYQIYVSFGIGDSLDKWSKITRVKFQSSNIQIDEAGVKIVVMQFVSHGSPLAYCNLMDTTMTYRLRSNMNRSLPINQPMSLRSDPILFNSQKDISLNRQTDICAKIITSYLSKIMGVTQKNIIVALPLVEFYSKDTGWLPNCALTVSGDLPRMRFLNPETVNEPTDKIVEEYSITMSTLQSTVTNTISQLQDFFYPLFKFGKFCSKNINQLDSEFVLYEESNIDVLDLWKTYGLIEDVKKNAIVFCPQYALSNILFCSKITRLEDSDSLDKWAAGIRVYSNGEEFQLSYKRYGMEYFLKFVKENLKSALDIPATPDEAALDESAKSLLDFDGVVFNHNTKNPNVLELQYSTNIFGNVYNVSLDSPVAKIMSDAYNQRGVEALISKDILDQLTGFTNYILKYYKLQLQDLTTINQYYDFIKNVVVRDLKSLASNMAINPLPSNRHITQVRKLIPDDLIRDIGSKKFIWILAQLVNPGLRSDFSSIKILADENASKSLLMHEKIISEMSIEVSLKTIPFFSLTFNNSWGRPCSLFSLKGKIIGTPEKTFKLNPFSGVYRIVGLKHTITDDDCYSEFKLTRVHGGSQQTDTEDMPNLLEITTLIDSGTQQAKTRGVIDFENLTTSTDYDIFGKQQ